MENLGLRPLRETTPRSVTRSGEASGARRAGGSRQERCEASLDLLTVNVGAECVQRMSRQRVFNEMPRLAEVHDRDDRPVRVVFDRDRTSVPAVTIDEVRERHDPFVAKGARTFAAHHPREVALLRPELGRVRELSEQVRNDPVDVERLPFGPHIEVLLRNVLREDARVVPEPRSRIRTCLSPRVSAGRAKPA
jgi:hypothetical protein